MEQSHINDNKLNTSNIGNTYNINIDTDINIDEKKTWF